MKTKIKSIVYVVVFFFMLFSVQALFAQSKLEKARKYKDNFQYAQAISLYSSKFKSATPRKATDIKDIAHCYMMMNDLNSAQKWLSKINSFTVYSPDEMLNYAISLKSSGDYENAINQYKRFETFFPEKSEKVKEWIKSCEIAQEWIAKPLPYEVINVQNLNTEFSDFGLIPYKNGLMFSSDRKQEGVIYKPEDYFGWTGNPYLRFFNVSEIKEDNLSSLPDLSVGINSSFHNGPGVFDNKSGTIYFTLTKMQKEKSLPTNSDPTSWVEVANTEKYTNRLEIYSALLKDNHWENVTAFEYNNSDKYSVGHPALSPDGNILYFVSNMPGGYGNSDIYYCRKLPDGHWSSPKNAGNVINSDGKEAFPVISSDGALYFSSDGFGGVGGLDIFRSTGIADKWTAPENMKYPFNSPRDDFQPYFTEPDISGYFSSNRDGGKGEDDIYYFGKKIVIIGTVKTSLYGKSIALLPEAEIKIENITKSKIEDKISDKDGLFIQKADCDNSYIITASKKGYLKQEKEISAICSVVNDTMHVEFILDKLLENKSFVLENIYYDFDKWDIRQDAAVELDKLVNILKENPEIDIELGSHTDCRGTDPYNKSLSQKRAEAAVGYIISKGIVSKRISAKGYGELKPRVDCPDGNCSDAEHQLNRRTEFTVTKVHKGK